ncbi:hypothetical protein AVEN_255696-1 [Araneus ventricosus]|uniref:Uncharacterized protein n=1 Tax=Araneus ventricosus TaxID=182803 RepID=A0A4Y2RIH0_ARAVE|nr:hypothetical protein AVEN_255696-1 [Araneus ventricosus]
MMRKCLEKYKRNQEQLIYEINVCRYGLKIFHLPVLKSASILKELLATLPCPWDEQLPPLLLIRRTSGTCERRKVRLPVVAPYGGVNTISGQTYFFKGRKFWQFNDNLMHVVPDKIRNANQYWFGCPSRTEEAPEEEDGEEGETDAFAASKAGLVCIASDCVTLISIAVAILLYRTRCALC